MSANAPVASERPTLADGPVGFNPRFPCLDGLRAIAACAVLVHHVSSATGTNTSVWPGWFFARMDAGVPIFFLPSGFLLYRPFVVAHFEDRARPAILPFFWRHALRILPAYWLVLTGAWLVLRTVHFSNPGDALWSYGLVQIYSKAHVLDGLVQAYSLCTEVAFYVFLPFFALALPRARHAARRAGRSRLTVELVAVAGLWCIGIGTHTWLLATHTSATPATLWLPAQLDLFALGMLLAIVSVWSAHRRDARRCSRSPVGTQRPAGSSPAPASRSRLWPWTCRAVLRRPHRSPGDVAAAVLRGHCVLPAAAGGLRTPGSRLRPAVPTDRGGRVARAGVLRDLPVAQGHLELVGGAGRSTGCRRPGSSRCSRSTFASTIVVAAASWYGLERPILLLKRWIPVTGRARVRT